MKPLQQYPNLFASYNFQVMYDGNPARIEAYHVGSNGMTIWNGYVDGWVHVDHLTLIARPLEDMTDEEVTSMMEVNSPTKSAIEDKIGKLKWLTKRGEIPLNDMKKLSDFGVYFGPQSHFKDETIIDIRTLQTQ